MPLKTPTFWYRSKDSSPSLSEHLLSAITPVYAAVHSHLQNKKQQIEPHKSHLPVICIGNLTAGGSGKTPTSRALANLLISSSMVKTPYFLTRGYGRTGNHPVILKQNSENTYKDNGDEALLLFQDLPVAISADRAVGAQMIEEDGGDLIIMDDGLLNHTLAKTVTFIAIDGAMGFGNGKTIPAGPLREPVSAGLTRGDAIVFIGEDRRDTLGRLPVNMPIFKANLDTPARDIPDKNQTYIGFSGLGFPDKFFYYASSLGLEFAETIAYPDHHPYTDADIERLLGKADKHGARLLTTEKDMIRVPLKFQNHIDVLPVTFHFENPASVLDFLSPYLLVE